jgi:hypothetical protein
MDLRMIAVLAGSLLALSAAFQLGLAAGAPWGAAAYGGRAIPGHGALPPAHRLGSGVSALVLLSVIWVVLAAVDLIARGPVSSTVLTILLWCLTVLFALNTLGNLRGRHPLERWGASTMTALLSVSCALIAVR